MCTVYTIIIGFKIVIFIVRKFPPFCCLPYAHESSAWPLGIFTGKVPFKATSGSVTRNTSSDKIIESTAVDNYAIGHNILTKIADQPVKSFVYVSWPVDPILKRDDHCSFAAVEICQTRVCRHCLQSVRYKIILVHPCLPESSWQGQNPRRNRCFHRPKILPPNYWPPFFPVRASLFLSGKFHSKSHVSYINESRNLLQTILGYIHKLVT